MVQALRCCPDHSGCRSAERLGIALPDSQPHKCWSPMVLRWSCKWHIEEICHENQPSRWSCGDWGINAPYWSCHGSNTPKTPASSGCSPHSEIWMGPLANKSPNSAQLALDDMLIRLLTAADKGVCVEFALHFASWWIAAWNEWEAKQCVRLPVRLVTLEEWQSKVSLR